MVVGLVVTLGAGVVEGAGLGGGGVGREIGDEGVVVGDLEGAATWLAEEVELKRGAGGGQPPDCDRCEPRMRYPAKGWPA